MPGENQNSNIAVSDAGQTQNQTIDYNALGQIIDKRVASTQDSVLKGALKSQYGLDGDELAEAVKAYKSQKEATKKAEAQQHQAIIDENARLKAQIQNDTIDKSLNALALKEGVPSEKMSFLSRLVSRDGLVGADGKVAEDKLKSALEDVLKAFPEFKTSASSGVVPLVGANTNGSNGTTTNAALNAIFGTGKK